MTIRSFRTPAALLAGIMLGVVLILGIGATQGEAATLLKGSFRGNAYATYANATAGPVATTLGRSAYQPCGCLGTNGKTFSNTVDSLETTDDGRTLKADGTRSTVFTEKGASSARAKNTSTVTGLSALDGTITADAIRAVSNTSANQRSITGGPTGSEFVNLKIAGRSIKGDVAPNTRVNLAGIGYVLLKGVKKGGNGETFGTTTVDMLTIVVTEDNTFALPVGSRIVVAHAFSGFSRTEPQVQMSGQAYAVQALGTANNTLKNRVGKAAFVTVGCEGTGGRVKTNNVNSLDVAGVLSSGTGQTTAYGKQLASGGAAKTTATVEDLFLLEGLITADAVTAVARDTFEDGRRTSSARGSGFVNLSIGGIPVPADAEPNTRVDLPRIGYVIVNEQTIPDPSSAERTQVNGLHVFVDQNNSLGLPTGLRLIVAHAHSSAVAF